MFGKRKVFLIMEHIRSNKIPFNIDGSYRVLVFQTWGIGDLIMATPIISALKTFPQVEKLFVAVGGETQKRLLISEIPEKDILIFPCSTSVVETYWKRLIFFRSLKRRKIDVAFVGTLHNRKSGFALKYFSNIKFVVGDSFPPKPMGYTHWQEFKRFFHRVEGSEQLVKLFFPNFAKGKMILGVDKNVRASSLEYISSFSKDLTNFGVHPGSGKLQKNKRVPPSKLIQILKAMLDNFPIRLFLFFGPEDMGIFSIFKDEFQHNLRVIFVQEKDIAKVAGIISQLKGFIASDSGLGHLAAALQIPVITIAGPTDFLATRPWGKNSQIILSEEKIICRPCYYKDSVPQSAVCLESIKTSQILDMVSSLIKC
ncbi:MAG: glycosyltransferase family 9 protein [Candidatus Riflebacteria bacterium]|nr:glycosyltransferase family 9 protein [Candidatus Riflebacteria bacterium]